MAVIHQLPISATIAALLAQLFGVVAMVLMFVWVLHYRGGINLNAENKSHIFNVHPFLMYVGYIFLSGEALMAFKIVWTERWMQKLVHTVFNLIGLALAILGVYAVFKFHSDFNIPNVYSLHSWIGIGTISLFGFQWLMGFLLFWYPRATKEIREKLAPWHALSGLVLFLLMICAAETGLVEIAAYNGLRRGAESRVVNFTGLFILLYGAAVTFAVLYRSS
ncbi:Cytochrome b561 [Cinnamomum micranthum f. kanehirae]|uniref:Cytochrome b561 n=1 Tax=Cinnamomum micranthum f. kanehirae TaxID=337451 RepID=A0A3S3MU39_9MAGN|nr:Cytochrome b561 [Cinnamomum micranthum f. kanehirae]